MNDESLARLRTIPHDGGSWVDLNRTESGRRLLTGAMRRLIEEGDFGSHPDVYGRMWWDRPAVTVKRECAHIGNGRYAHPEQDRLCSLREMAILNGFPSTFTFAGESLSNQYRHVGDAVPPLVSHQLASCVLWTLGENRPDLRDCILPDTSLDNERKVRCIVENQLDMYIRNQAEIVKEYNGKIIAVKDGKVIGDYLSRLEAVNDMRKKGHDEGT
jgi:DNA (cytosine-5)-methyltransferase 1